MSHPEFGKIRACLWPIYRHELKKILPMMLIMFFICFNYTILRNIKDAVVVTAKSSGAEVIPFIKVWVLLPMAVLATLIFTKLSSRFSQEKVFYITISAFLVFFALFTFVLFPLQDHLHPHQTADYLESLLPLGFKGLIAMFRNWTFTFFYVFCELWSTMVLSVLFWGFANEVTKITEARRFYSRFSVIASFSSIVAGVSANLLTNNQNWDRTLEILMMTVIVFGCVTMVIFRWMNKNVLNASEFDELHETRSNQLKPKKRMSIRESLNYLVNSKYLICIALIVICYNLFINVVEIVWKDQLRQLYPETVNYSRYMNYMTSAVGIIATLTSLFMAQLIARFGWTWTALITPIIMLLTSVGFFSFMLFREDLTGPVNYFIGTTPLAIAVFFGAAQVCMSKACKYSVFDSTKEMAFIPLGHETKLRGKAAIDGVGSRAGKSGGSIIHQGLLILFGTVAASAPYVAAILLLVICCWVYAVRSLGKQFASIIGDRGREEIGEVDADSADAVNLSKGAEGVNANTIKPTFVPISH